MASFTENLAFGKIAESKIAQWLVARGHYILPVYEMLNDEKVGPRLFGPGQDFIAPDILVWNHRGTHWIEAKHKTVFTWHRLTRQWVTGIDRRHYHSYLGLAKAWQPWPIWLLFLHESNEPDERDRPHCIGDSPTGLYGDELLSLSQKVNHEHDNWGKTGMVYWAESNLKQLATLKEINNVSKRRSAQWT